MTFIQELENLINRHSRENESNTPDFILAKYLEQCLLAFETATKAREHWFRRPSAMHRAMYDIMQKRKQPRGKLPWQTVRTQ